MRKRLGTMQQIGLLLVVLLVGCSASRPAGQPRNSNLVPVKVEVADAFKNLPPFKGKLRTLMAPKGYRIQVFSAGDLVEPRFMDFGPDGALYVADQAADRIARLEDHNADGIADRSTTQVGGLRRPHSVVWRGGDLYVGDMWGASRFRQGKGGRELLIDQSKSDPQGHTTRTVVFGPDGRLYLAVGSTCDVCVETDPYRAAVWVSDADGKSAHLFAKGLRNAIGLAFNPKTNELWAADMGRDHLGDDAPPDEINVLQAGGDYGWPVCHGGTIIDPELGQPDSCQGKIAPIVNIQAHSSPIGLTFWQGDAYVAFHGSWNRSVPTGYKIVRIPLSPEGKPLSNKGYEDFVTGWLTATGEIWGRPAGLTVGKDGALYLSDDRFGVIYRIIPPQ